MNQFPFVEVHHCWDNEIKLFVEDERDRQWYSLQGMREQGNERTYVAVKNTWNHQLRDIINPGATVFDLGANSGYISTLFAKRVGPKGKIIAVEPNPHNCNKIAIHAAINDLDNLEIVEAAVYDEPGIAKLWFEFLRPYADRDPLEVSAVTVDQLTERYGPPDAIKCDVDGCDWQAMNGARKTLMEHAPKIELEVHDWPADQPYSILQHGKTAQDIWDLMASFGYKAFVHGRETGPFCAAVYFVKQ